MTSASRTPEWRRTLGWKTYSSNMGSVWRAWRDVAEPYGRRGTQELTAR